MRLRQENAAGQQKFRTLGAGPGPPGGALPSFLRGLLGNMLACSLLRRGTRDSLYLCMDL